MRVREARPADAAGMGRVHVASWRTTYAGLLPDDYLARLSPERSGENWRRGLTQPAAKSFYLAAEDSRGDIIGFACAGPEREGRADYQAELYAIYLLASHQRQGVGRALVAETARRLLAHELAGLLVWVLAGNPSRRFYETLGGAPAGEKPIEIGGTTLVEVAYGWHDLAPLAQGRGPRPPA